MICHRNNIRFRLTNDVVVQLMALRKSSEERMSSELVIDIEWKINFRKFPSKIVWERDEASRETDDDDVSDKLVCEKKMIENFTKH